MIQNTPPHESGELSTWAKTKDVLLVGAAGIGVTLVLVILVKVTNIEIQLATYQAESKALDRRVQKIEGSLDEHFRDDRTKFQTVGVK